MARKIAPISISGMTQPEINIVDKAAKKKHLSRSSLMIIASVEKAEQILSGKLAEAAKR